MNEYTLVFLAVVCGATVIGAYVIVFALGLMADRAKEYREDVEAEVKAEHREAAQRQVEEFLAEVTREQAMSFSRLQAEAYEQDVARLAAMN